MAEVVAPKSPVDFAHIPSGPFIYGPEACYERLAQCPPLKPQQTIELPEYWIAKRPVTYREWREFLEATGYRWGGQWYRVVHGWRGVFIRAFAPTHSYPADHADFPIVDVTQADAYAYCEWLTTKLQRRCTLPTEAQWEKAGRGVDGRLYPWGNEPPRPEIQWQKKFPVGLESYFFSLLVKPTREWARAGWYWRNGHLLSVGACPYNVSPHGCVDMSGNIWEWTCSLYNPALPDFHVVKGGSWGYSIHHTKLNVRSACSVTIPSREYRAQGTGFRVAIMDN
ncbi:MAG TPA: SUMF1/EgtB/PvdO family nonheme iron enzyme [Anaerolineales bacterium]|nr:SUMF1/EgtB/PvdO family nonheme iron enzyme [Anaerolineales bacterium]HLF02003.1 SUMF1/EgtB/PvdO family nonheme iron enzyme [Anaerolineales bacterium]